MSSIDSGAVSEGKKSAVKVGCPPAMNLVRSVGSWKNTGEAQLNEVAHLPRRELNARLATWRLSG
jgi:hypothetical protein